MNNPITEVQFITEQSKCREHLKGELRDWLDAHEKAEFAKHDQIDRSLRDLTVAVGILTDTFQQGRGALGVLKWLAVIGAAAWALLVWAKDHLRL